MQDADTTRSTDAGAPAGVPAPEPVPLSTIFWVFFQIGSLSVGGGLTAWLYREIVEQRRLMSEADFLGALTLAQVMPGINMSNLSICVGQRLRGLPGALTAIFGLLLVPFFAIILVGSIYARLVSYPWLQHMLDGMASVAVGLLLAMGAKAIRATRLDLAQLAIVAIVILTVGVLRWPMIPIICVMAPVSVALAWRKEQAPERGERPDA